MGKLFGTDGIRGVVGENLTADLAFRVGQAVGAVLMEEKGGARPAAVLGKDTRISSDTLEAGKFRLFQQCGYGRRILNLLRGCGVGIGRPLAAHGKTKALVFFVCNPLGQLFRPFSVVGIGIYPD